MVEKNIKQLIIGFFLIIFSLFSVASFAGTPVFTVNSIVKAPTQIVKNRTAITTYQVTNTSPVTLQGNGVVRLPSGVTQATGAGLCSSLFNLSKGASCTLQLNINRSSAGTIQGGPIVCHTPSHQAYCSQPPSGDQLNTQIVDSSSGDMPTLTLSPSSELILIPGTAVDLTVTNTSTTTAANNVDITLPSMIESEVETKTRTGCDNIAAGGTCTISITAKTGAAIDPFPQPATVQGSNTQTANISVDIQGEVTGSTVTFSSPGAQNLTLTNNSSSDVTVNSVTLSSGINNVTVGSISDCQPLAASSTCNVPLTAVQTSYGSGTATVTYNTTKTVTPAPTVVVDNTTLSISDTMDLEADQSGQDFTVTNNGNFTWQNADFNLAAPLTGVTPDYSDCTSTPLTPTNSCTITFNTSGANVGDNTILSTTGDNIDTYTSNVTIVGDLVVEVDTDADNINLGYRALKVRNTSLTNPVGRITSVTSSMPTKIHFCANGDTSCTHQSTCVLNQDIPASSDCLIWLKALDADQSVETADVDVTVDGNYPVSTTGKNSHHKINAAFSHVFNVAYSKSLFAGGNFTTAGGITVNRIAKWDGSAWSALASGGQTGANFSIYAFTNDTSGNLYAGGLFTTAGGITVNRIAKWNGSVWSALVSGGQTGMNNTVNALTNDNSGDLYAGGSFTTAGGITVNRVAKWDGSAWSALASGGQTGIGGGGDSVQALTSDSSGNIYAGGLFETAGGMTVNYITKWNGSAWSDLASGGQTGTNYYVNALTIDDLGQLYAGGDFDAAGGIAVNKIAKWAGSAWSALASGGQTGVGGGFQWYVLALTNYNSENVYAGGIFTTAGGMTVNRVAKWNDSASTWSALATGVGTEEDDYVEALANDNSGNLFAGGNFITAGGMTVNSIAKWNGSAWSALTSGGQTGVNGNVLAFYILPIIESITAVSTTTPRFKNKTFKPENKHHAQKK
ncbi:MAG: hypothetical protein PVI75_02905 [Gammaproteobacteria bacterium]|jgi:hypothetical protein